MLWVDTYEVRFSMVLKKMKKQQELLFAVNTRKTQYTFHILKGF